MTDAILVEELTKNFGKTRALNRLSFGAAAGCVVGLLGPNRAGKTTTVRILATLLRPDSGKAAVCGIDVLAAPRKVRALIGLTGQFTAVDDLLTGAENLVLVGRLARLSLRTARQRTAELIDRLDLGQDARKLVKTYSGGTRRRLDLAMSLINRPSVLFLDEPTTGLDLRSRLSLWEAVRDLARDGTTVLLTTQYLEEADRLADTIAVIDRGQVVVAGTPAGLKAQIGGDRVEIGLSDPAQLAGAVEIIGRLGKATPAVDENVARVTLPLPGGDPSGVPGILGELHAHGVGVADIAVRHPTLDDVFLTLTGTGPALPEETERPPELATARSASAVGHVSGQESTAGHVFSQESTVGQVSGQGSTGSKR